MNSLASRNVTQKVNEKIVFSSESSSLNIDHVKLAESFLESFSRNDMSAAINLFSDECAWHFPGNLFFKPEYKGINEIIVLLKIIYGLFPGGLRVLPESFFHDKNNTLQIRWKSSASIRTGGYRNNGVMNITFDDSGLIKKIEEYLDSAKLCNLFNQIN